MIICRTPLRISLFGGGTDFKEWFEYNGGMAISMAINQYCYSTLRNLPNIHPFKYRLRYFKNEFTKNISGIKHKSIRAVLEEFAEKKIVWKLYIVQTYLLYQAWAQARHLL